MNKKDINPPETEIKNLIREYQERRFDNAIKLALSITQRFPTNQFSWKVLGGLLGITGKHHEAIKANQKALDLLPNDNEVHNNMGNSYRALGKLDYAYKSYKEAIRYKINFTQAYNNLAITLQALGKFDEAIINYKKAIELEPNYPQTHNNLGITQKEIGKLDDAVRSYKKAIELKPDYSEAFNNLGLTLRELNKLIQSEESYKKAIELNPEQAEYHNNLGVTLNELSKLDESEKSYNKAIKLNPEYIECYTNLGITLQELGKLDESEESYKKAIELKPNYAEANYCLSLLYNLRGDLKKGFKLYEWRYHEKKKITRPPNKKFFWDGEKSIKNKKILVYGEQGFGDTIQFFRYLSILQNMGADVIFKVKSNLHHLFNAPNDKIQIIDNFPETNKIDFESPLMSLPYLLKTDLNSIPSSVPYLKADISKIDEWGKKLNSKKFKIGICWQGSKTKVDKGRSFPLSLFKDISKIPNLELISLYKGDEENQILNIDFDLNNLGNNFDNEKHAFIDTAAIMMHCDLIITSDTAIAHLAGALGRPVWVALKHIPEWRWMLNRSDSPWYPTMNLYRQNKLNDWGYVFDLMKKDLKEIVSNKSNQI